MVNVLPVIAVAELSRPTLAAPVMLSELPDTAPVDSVAPATVPVAVSAAQETAPKASTPVVNTSVQFTSLHSSWSQRVRLSLEGRGPDLHAVQVQRARRLLHQPGDRPAEGSEATQATPCGLSSVWVRALASLRTPLFPGVNPFLPFWGPPFLRRTFPYLDVANKLLGIIGLAIHSSHHVFSMGSGACLPSPPVAPPLSFLPFWGPPFLRRTFPYLGSTPGVEHQGKERSLIERGGPPRRPHRVRAGKRPNPY